MSVMHKRRSTLPKDEARRRYVELAELQVLERIRDDARDLDRGALAVGPFARLDANALAAKVGKTRGALSNLFGNQAALQAATMAMALDAAELLEASPRPEPEGYEHAEEWLDALFLGESARGPLHRGRPAVDYGSLWALWLAAVPYGLWGERIAGPSLDEFRDSVGTLSSLFARALDHFGLELAADVTLTDLATAAVNLVEGAWLNQCLTTEHPCDAAEPVSEALRRSGRLLWRGATASAGAARS
ncbi:MAG TPA: hypothetical protein VD836_04340 [Solirubrobacteraceae bacterium]|nr:hypothetical protein [Solirubrobacteraceae bacterium]